MKSNFIFTDTNISSEVTKKLNEIKAPDHIKAANLWFIENGILNEHVKNNLILYVSCFSELIKDVEIYIKNDDKEIQFLLYLSRFSIYFNSKKIYNKLKPILQNYLYKYTVKISFAIYKDSKYDQKKEKNKKV